MTKLLGCLILSAPLFVLIFLEIVINLISYRKTVRNPNETKRMFAFLIMSMGVLLVLNLCVALIYTFDLRFVFFANTLLSVLALNVLNSMEQYLINYTSNETLLRKKTLIIDCALACAYCVFHSCFLLLWVLSYLEDSDWFGKTESKVDAKYGIKLLIGYIVLVLIFTLIKAIIQYSICKKRSKKQIEG